MYQSCLIKVIYIMRADIKEAIDILYLYQDFFRAPFVDQIGFSKWCKNENNPYKSDVREYSHYLMVALQPSVSDWKEALGESPGQFSKDKLVKILKDRSPLVDNIRRKGINFKTKARVHGLIKEWYKKHPESNDLYSQRKQKIIYLKKQQILQNGCNKYLSHLEGSIKSDLKDLSPLLYYKVFEKKEEVIIFKNKKITERKVQVGGMDYLEQMCKEKTEGSGTIESEYAKDFQNILKENVRIRNGLEKYRSMKILSKTLRGHQHVDDNLNNFHEEYKRQKPIITQRRDSATTTFLKVVTSVALTATIVGAFFVHKIWETTGDQASEEFESNLLTKTINT